MHEPRVPEQRHRQLSVVSTVDTPSQDLVNEVVDDTMQEIVPRELEKQVLQMPLSGRNYQAYFTKTYQ